MTLSPPAEETQALLSPLDALRRKQGLPSLSLEEDETVKRLVLWLEESLSGWSAVRIREGRLRYLRTCRPEKGQKSYSPVGEEGEDPFRPSS